MTTDTEGLPQIRVHCRVSDAEGIVRVSIEQSDGVERQLLVMSLAPLHDERVHAALMALIDASIVASEGCAVVGTIQMGEAPHERKVGHA